MAEFKLTKNELRIQQLRLVQLNRYLPTLRLKKAMLQAEVAIARHEIERLEREYQQELSQVQQFSALLPLPLPIDLPLLAHVEEVEKEYENIAGIEVPKLKAVRFKEAFYPLVDSPPWLDSATVKLRHLVKAKNERLVAEEKKSALEEELRQVSIRVNLFEKILIPRAESYIKKIKVFLGDQELAAVSQAKVAKTKIVRGSCKTKVGH